MRFSMINFRHVTRCGCGQTAQLQLCCLPNLHPFCPHSVTTSFNRTHTPSAIMSKHDDNFDLYDDPYADTGAITGSDPYADDDDGFYNSSSSLGHRSDHGRHRDERVKQEHDNSHYSNNQSRQDDHSRYSNNNDHDDYQSREGKREASPSGYDPAQPYHQQRDNSQYQQLKQESSQHTRPSQGGYGSNMDRGNLYDQSNSYGQQQQQQQPSAQSTSSNRELG
jgi:hypothetical protein